MLKKLSSYILILLGLFILFMIQQPIAAGVCLLLGIVMIFEQICPEKWEANSKD